MKIDQKLVGDYAPDFELPGIDKQVYHLGRYLEQYNAIAVIFISNQCPVVNKYLDTIKQIQAEFNSQGFSFIGINSSNNPEESLESMQLFAQNNNLSFPYLKDPNQDVAKTFGIKVTPEVFLLDNKSVIRYAGSIEDADTINKSYLRDSIASLLSGQEIVITYHEPIGTPLKWRTK